MAERRPEKEKASLPRNGRTNGEGWAESVSVGVVGRRAHAERAAPGEPAPSDHGIWVAERVRVSDEIHQRKPRLPHRHCDAP